MKRCLSLVLILSLVATSAFAQVIRHPSPQEVDPVFSAWDKDYSDLINTPDLSVYLTDESDPVWSVDKALYQTADQADAKYLQAEVDPVFTAWDKDYADIINTPDLSVYAQLSGAEFSGIVSATNLSGTNTGDQDLSGYWENDGTATATGDWDIGGYSFNAKNIYYDALENNYIGAVTTNSLTTGHDNFLAGSGDTPLTTGYSNIKIGDSTTLGLATTTRDNIALGDGALGGITTSSYFYNIGIGNEAGRYYATSTNARPTKSMYIGGFTKASGSAPSSEVVVGYNAVGKGDNTFTFGDAGVSTLKYYMYGDWINNKDSKYIKLGAGEDFWIGYDGTNAIVNPKAVGSGILDVQGLTQVGGLNVKGSENTPYPTGGSAPFAVHQGNDYENWTAFFYNDVYSTTQPIFTYYGYNSGKFAQGTEVATELAFYTNGFTNERLVISATGNFDFKAGSLTSTGNIYSKADNAKHYLGAADDAAIYYGGTNLVINPKEVGSGYLSVLGDTFIDGYIKTPNSGQSTGGENFVNKLGASVQETSLNPATNNIDNLWVSVTHDDTAGVRRAGMFVTEFTGTSASSSANQGLNAFAITSASATGDLSATTLGGGLRNRYVVRHDGSGIVSLASAVSAGVIANGGDITKASFYNAETPTVATGKTIGDLAGFRVTGGTPSGTITTRYGLKVDSLLGGTKKWGVYVDADDSFFGGKIALTQTDGNEFIGSLNDGYMDYGATIQHRFNKDVDVVGAITTGSSGNKVEISEEGIVYTGTARPKRSFYVSSTGMFPTITNGAGIPTKLETETYKVNYYSSAFAGGENKSTEFTTPLPGSWDGGAVSIIFYYIPAGTTGGNEITWGIKGSLIGDNVSMDTDYGTEVKVSDTIQTAGRLHTTAETAPMTISGTLGGDQIIQWKITRDAVSDSNADEASLVGVLVKFTAKQETDVQ